MSAKFPYKGRILMIGYGSVGRCTMPLIERHFDMPMSRITVVDAVAERPDHLHAAFELSGGRELRFRDPRRFGSIAFHADETAIAARFAEIGLGPEPFAIDAA